jgi:hypothetical protein
MPENGRFNRSIDQIELAFVEREATPEFLMKLSIQLHLSDLSLSNTVRVLEVFGGPMFIGLMRPPCRAFVCKAARRG